MSKQLAHLVLIISLVGQFLLTPAMAMPSLLHAYSHAQMNDVEHDAAGVSTMIETAVKSQLLPPQSPLLTGQSDTLDSRQNCDAIAGILVNDNSDVSIDCDALCEMMGVGECVSHCANATGILIQANFALQVPESSASIQAGFWSTQTADPAPFNPPPIRTV
ncbi:hypothetical protein [Shewanella woodyi]|uniref:Uncharacterized protein n=1 Tax=Shewanella woodyi (strain ATCC 51908 / MS32) TaxID=392500 RepID=B1KM82_SHEWM|nr:hypothetical protein [Shewanella woodyi]ACA84495.1 conserved hypothetical protein [Shewanella woodyi ATCC 51908]